MRGFFYFRILKNLFNMGKGDKKTARGKRFAGSFGKFRLRIALKKKAIAAAATK